MNKRAQAIDTAVRRAKAAGLWLHIRVPDFAGYRCAGKEWIPCARTLLRFVRGDYYISNGNQ